MKQAFSQAQMSIWKPVQMVFEAMVDPEITTQFWFTNSSGKLELDKTVTWQWEMYGASADVYVIEAVPNEKIVFEWGDDRRKVVFEFKASSAKSTYMTATETGYKETGDDLLAAIRDSTGGFTTVLDGMKAWLEHGIKLNLIGDKFPVGK